MEVRNKNYLVRSFSHMQAWPPLHLLQTVVGVNILVMLIIDC